ncbi:MAG TPA: YraN family protein [Actinophytocola sp.]|uniref:YraN family protein n=1 Tax=Actinophytocola sp. TaxID=1872138 RepID=UPI002DB8B07A|nr:YraN family protein [Actinophytocola sp.]HEU5470349.1 YraN family protein [Actinophytocola sp.]
MTTSNPTRPTRPPAHLALGRRGESLATQYLIKHGLIPLARNWRCPTGELDLVAYDPRVPTLVVCEVKTRTSNAYGTPAEAVTDTKATRIRRTARHWQHTRALPHLPTRFDIIAILWPPGRTPRIQHYKAAF